MEFEGYKCWVDCRRQSRCRLGCRCRINQRAGRSRQAVAALSVFLEPAMQNAGVHAVQQGLSRDRSARLLAGCHQFGFELRGVGAGCATHRITRGLRFYEHSVHARLRVHDLAQSPRPLQDGVAVCLPVSEIGLSIGSVSRR